MKLPQKYKATALVLVGGSDSLPLVGSVTSPQSLSPATAAGLIHMRTIATKVQGALHSSRSTGDLLGRVVATPNTQSGIVMVTARGSSAAEASSIANAFASQFVATRAEAPYVRLTKAVAAVQRSLKTVPAHGSQHDALLAQLTQLRALAALPTSDAQVVDHAIPP